jgi:hypothetical protein
LYNIRHPPVPIKKSSIKTTFSQERKHYRVDRGVPGPNAYSIPKNIHTVNNTSTLRLQQKFHKDTRKVDFIKY